MKRLDLLFALLVFLAIAVGIQRGRSAAPDASLFGEEMALAPELPPLVLPGGSLELHGQLLTAEGQPAEEAFVALLPVREGADESAPIHPAYTDAEGRFVVRGLAPGSYRAVLTHPSAPPRELPVELLQSEEVHWELAPPLPPLPSLPPLRRTGLVGHLLAQSSAAPGPAEEASPSALEGFEVVLFPADDTPLLAAAAERRASTDALGRFALEDLVAARYRVEVLPPWARGGSWPVIGRGSVEPSEGEPATLDLTLEVGALEGELREADGRPLSGALVVVSSLDQRDPVGAPQLWPPSVTDVAGRFAVELLPPGRYQVHLRAGSAAQDRQVGIESGRRTRIPALQLDPRAGADLPGG